MFLSIVYNQCKLLDVDFWGMVSLEPIIICLHDSLFCLEVKMDVRQIAAVALMVCNEMGLLWYCRLIEKPVV